VKRTVPAFFAIFFLAALAAYPQSSFLKTGQTGLGISGAFTANPNVSGFSGRAGIALYGIFDLSVSEGRNAYDPVLFGDLKATSTVPEIRAYLAKQNSSKSPVTASISVGYASDKFSSPDFVPDGIVMRGNSMLFSGTISRDVLLSRKAYVQPYAGIGYTSTTVKATNSRGVTLVFTSDILISLNLGVPLVYGLSDRTMVVLQPSLSLDKNDVTFAISLGLIAALTKARI